MSKLQTAGPLQIKSGHWTLTSQRTYGQKCRLLLIVLVHIHNPTSYWHSHARPGITGLKTGSLLTKSGLPFSKIKVIIADFQFHYYFHKTPLQSLLCKSSQVTVNSDSYYAVSLHVGVQFS